MPAPPTGAGAAPARVASLAAAALLAIPPTAAGEPAGLPLEETVGKAGERPEERPAGGSAETKDRETGEATAPRGDRSLPKRALHERARQGAARAAAEGAAQPPKPPPEPPEAEARRAGDAPPGPEDAPKETRQDPEPEDPPPPDFVLRYSEEVRVTGTAIRDTPIDSPHSVAVLNREALQQQGAPQLVDLFKNLTVSSGVLGEVNSWASGSPGVAETVANVNLRGLGASRTLVLLNGRRSAYVPAQLPGGRYVDVNTIPGIAVERMDVLKEGAGAIYGSDAIAGVVNFVTRNRFEGLEVQASHEYYAGGGDSRFSGIWGERFGRASVMAALEHQRLRQLRADERAFVLRPYPDWGWGWSGVGKPGAFIVPGPGPVDERTLAAAPRFLDPACDDFGGYADRAFRSCRFRYQTYDSMIYATRQTRGVVEVTGEVGEHGHYRMEGLYARARIPEWETTPSFGPVAQFDRIQRVGPDHPGRQAFLAGNPEVTDTSGNPLDLGGDRPWYYFGRLVGASGPGRVVSSRRSVTRRFAASLGGELGETRLHYDLGAVYARATGAVGRPAEYAWRKFLAHRGFGGPDCGVGVVVDPDSPTRIGLGPVPEGLVPGQGRCRYFNPFSNGMQYSEQPGAPFETAANPDYRPDLTNPPELIAWINEEVVMHSRSDLFTADATLNGDLTEAVRYAAGYQVRRVSATGRPNEAGDLTRNPCFVPGDTGCAIQTGPFTFTAARTPYDARQTTHAGFLELALGFGERLDAQVAGHYERYEFADSWDPKVSVLWKLSDRFALRGTVQTTFRTPSLDDVNEAVTTTLEPVVEAGSWKAIDDRGSAALVPEEAFTFDLGVTAKDEAAGLEATLDYWSFDFDDPIGVLPHAALTAAYADPATRAAVAERIVCVGGVTDGSCDPTDIERVRVQRINWPGLTTSGLDWHLGIRRALGRGALVFDWNGSATLDYTVEALDYAGVELRAEEQAAGYFNRTNPLAPPLPRLRTHAVASYFFGNATLTGAARYLSGYRDRDAAPRYRDITSWLTFDATVRYRVSATGLLVTLSAFNLAGADPPLVNWDPAFDPLTHNPKGRRLKLTLGYRY